MLTTRVRAVFWFFGNAAFLSFETGGGRLNSTSALVVEVSDGLLTVAPAGFYRKRCRVGLGASLTETHAPKKPGSQTRRVSTRPEISRGEVSSVNIRADLGFSGATGGP